MVQAQLVPQAEVHPQFDYQSAIYQAGGDAKSGAVSGSSLRYISLSRIRANNPLFTAIIEGAQESIGGQIAVKITLEAMVKHVLDLPEHYFSLERDKLERNKAVQEVFQVANARIYEYGHRMTGAGRICAQGIVSIFDGDRVSIAQVGRFESFLWRDKKVLRFHQSGVRLYEGERQGEGLARYIGATQDISVDVASVRVKDSDVIVVTSLLPDDRLLGVVDKVLRTMSSVEEGSKKLATQTAAFEQSAKSGAPVVFMIQVGPPTITLRHVVFEENATISQTATKAIK